MHISDILEKKNLHQDKNGIWVANYHLDKKSEISHTRWESIYSCTMKQLHKLKIDFKKDKLKDHIGYINSSYQFSKNSIYLEIGCGPAFIGEYLIQKYDVFFIGVDFNYSMLYTLKKYFQKKGYKKCIFIHADISNIPLKKNSVNYIYGGGVIEHLDNTKKIVNELHRVLLKRGVSFNTVPAFNLFWLLRFWNNIPNVPFIKDLFEFVHINILNSKILSKYYGYELSYSESELKTIHSEIGFKNIHTGAFVINPSENKMSNPILRKVYMMVTSYKLLSPVYYVYGTK